MSDKPYRAKMHYDPTVEGVWIGMGRDMNPVCGHPDYIAVTGHVDIVECHNCLRSIDKDRSVTS